MFASEIFVYGAGRVFLFTVYSNLFTIYRNLYTVYSNFFTIYSNLFTVNGNLFTIYRSLFTVYSNLFTIFSNFSVQKWKFSLFLLNSHCCSRWYRIEVCLQCTVICLQYLVIFLQCAVICLQYTAIYLQCTVILFTVHCNPAHAWYLWYWIPFRSNPQSL